MRSKLFGAVCFVCAMIFCLRPSEASPLALSYDITQLESGLYQYDFKLTLDNNDGTWDIGQSWDWFVYGDANYGSPSPLGPYNPTNDPTIGFVGDDSKLPVGPWAGYNYSTGGHNGPTLVNFDAGWKPLAVNDSLSWSGTSPFFVGEGKMLFSTLKNYAPDGFVQFPYTDDSGNYIDPNTYAYNGPFYEVAKLGNVTVTPEPASMLLFGLGGATLAFFRRKE